MGVVTALALYVLWVTATSGTTPIGSLMLMLVFTGTAFAPTRWREVGPLAGIATAVLAGVLTIGTLVAGRGSILLRPIGEIGSILFGLYLVNFICFSAGYAVFSALKAALRRTS